jgi:gluconokinase
VGTPLLNLRNKRNKEAMMVQSIVVMGVSGCGKSSVAQSLVQLLNQSPENLSAAAVRLPTVQPGNWLYADADDFHPPQNVAKMRAGQALDDTDRAPWLQSLNQLLSQRANAGLGTVLACSALKERYRQALSIDLEERTQFIHLVGSFELINERMQARKNHYMPASLLRSQFEALETPQYAITIQIDQPLHAIISQISFELNKP